MSLPALDFSTLIGLPSRQSRAEVYLQWVEPLRFRFQVSGVGSHWVSWSLRPFPAPASLFSAAAHTLGFYRTFEGRFNLSAFPNLGVYNLLGGEQRQAQVGPCVSTVPDYLNSGYTLCYNSQVVCTANGRRSISNTLRQTKFVSTSIFEVVQVRVAPPRM